MMQVLLLVFGAMMLTAGVVALYSRDIIASIVAAGVVSLFASILYLMFGAPDVAMTEAAIGSALTTVVFLLAWSRIRSLSEGDSSVDEEVN